MSFRGLRNRQESCTYRLNRAALMRMEEGRRKALTKEEGYYDERVICIQLDNKRFSQQGASQSNSQSENETSRTEEDSEDFEEIAKLRKLQHYTRKNRDSSSVSSNKLRASRRYKPRGEISTYQNLRPGNRKKTSSTFHQETESENKELNERRASIEASPKQKRRAKRRPQASQTASPVQRSVTPVLEVKAKAIQPRPKYSRSSSRSSDQWFQEKTGSPIKRNQTNREGIVAGPSSPSKSFTIKTDRNIKSEEEIAFLKSSLSDPMRIESSYAAVKQAKPVSAIPKRSEKETPQVNPKSPLDDSLLIKPVKLNEELSEELKGASSELSPEVIGSRESAKKKGKSRSARSSSSKRSGLRRPSQASRRLYFRPLTSTVTMASDQEEVISTWRRRLGTSSPPSNIYHNIRSPIIASSFLRDSHVLRVQGTGNLAGKESYSNPADLSDLIPEKEPPDFSLENVGLKSFLRPMTGKGSKEYFTANEEQEIFLRLEMEKTKKQIHYLEELARIKLQKLEAIRWKKKRALEEEAVLNDKLEKLLYKIQELRESDSFAKLLDKQTQVFATKRVRPNF